MDVQTRFISATLRRAVRLHDEGYPLCVLPLVWDKLSVVVSDSFGDGAQSSLTVQGFMCSSLWLLHNFHFHTCITGTGCAMGTVRLSLMQWRRPGGAVVQVYWTEHPQDGALEWSSTGPPSGAAATALRVSSSELSHCVYYRRLLVLTGHRYCVAHARAGASLHVVALL